MANSEKKDFTIFLVEDDKFYAELLSYHLSMNPDYVVKKFATAKDCLQNLYLNPDVISLDYSLPDGNGKELAKKIKTIVPSTPIIIISGQNNIQIAIDLLQEDNVHDYIVKDSDAKDRLWKAIIKIREKNILKEEVEQLRDELGHKYDFSNMIKGSSLAIQAVFKLMKKACDNNITVSITGETGTGKELVANCIHYNSNRKKKTFVAVNMTAIPKDLIESELFGHEKGAFTGAQARRIGKFEEAHNGTIFLDEIADMDISLQGKLLRVLQERQVTRIGSNTPVDIDVRIIVATYKNLAEEVKKGNFREDLYYRLLGLPIELPPLRDRTEDILIMAKHFADQFSKENKKPKKNFSKEAKAKITKYPFPGNVRELKAIVDLAMVMSDEEYIQEDDITFNSSISEVDLVSEENTLKGYIAKVIQHHMKKYNNDVGLVAQKLDIGKSTLYKMIQRGDV